MKTRYWLHLEDDFEFFEPRNHVADAIDILEDDPTLGQVLFNRSYAEGPDDRDIETGWVRHTRRRQRYLLHRHGAPAAGRRSASWWPHFSLRPSMMARDAITRVGAFDAEADHFELDFAQRYSQRGLSSAFFDTICCEHIGRKTGARGDSATPNAYQLTGSPQFGEKPAPIRVTATITSCRRPELLAQMLDSLRAHCQDLERVANWLCVDDGTEDADLRRLEARFPFVQFVCKKASERGHASSINRILEDATGRFVLHLEDDWQFTRDFELGPLIDIMATGQWQQIALVPRPSSTPVLHPSLQLRRCRYNPAHPDKPAHYQEYDARRDGGAGVGVDDGFWWPGFTLNPSLMDADFFRATVGEVDTDIGDDLFEYDYALRAMEAGAQILCIDLGVVHRGAVSAYTLNERPRAWD